MTSIITDLVDGFKNLVNGEPVNDEPVNNKPVIKVDDFTKSDEEVMYPVIETDSEQNDEKEQEGGAMDDDENSQYWESQYYKWKFHYLSSTGR